MDNRANILQCALELFTERGYDAVGVQEVAERAQITKPTLYHYYGSKLGLLSAMLEQYQAPLNRKVAEASAYHGWLPHTLEALARTFFQYAQENPVYYRMQLALYFAPRSSEGHKLIATYDEEQHASVEAMFAAAVKEYGNMRGKHKLYAAMFIGALNTCIGLWLSGYAQLDDNMIQAVLKQFQYGIYS